MSASPSVLFTNAFLSYLLVFVVFVITVVVAVIIGVTVAKNRERNKMNQAEENDDAIEPPITIE